MLETVEIFMPLLAPLILGVVTTAVASTFVTAKRLRNELQQESEMVDRLPPDAQNELRAELRRRALLLVSVNRFPPFTRVDLLALFGVGVGLATGGFFVHAIATRRIEEPGFGILALAVPLYCFVSWNLFHPHWAKRALSRLRYVDKKLGQDESQPLARMIRIGYYLSLLAAMSIAALAVVILGTWVYINEYLSEEWIVIAGSVTFTASIFLINALTAHGADLDLFMELMYVNSRDETVETFGEQYVLRFEAERDKAFEPGTAKRPPAKSRRRWFRRKLETSGE
jgi:hypothetical protein